MRAVEGFSSVSAADVPVLVDVQEGDGAADVRIAVFGDLDRPGASPLERAVIHVLREQRPAHLEIDLAGVPFLDAGGVRVLLQCRTDARQLGCRVTLTNVQPEAYRVLEIVSLLDPFGVAGFGRSLNSYGPSPALPSGAGAGLATGRR